jgi:hypothetical protein
LFIYPENRGIGTSQLDSRLNPRDSRFVNKIVPSIKPVNMRQQQNLLARLDFGAMIQQAIDGHGGPLRNSLFGGHNKPYHCIKSADECASLPTGRQAKLYNAVLFYILWGTCDFT